MIKAMKQWLEALEINLVFLRNVKPFKGQEDLASDCIAMTEETITSLSQAIAEAEKQEPAAVGLLSVRYHRGSKLVPITEFDYKGELPEGDYELYTQPQPKAEQDEPAIDTTPSQPAIDTTPQPKQEEQEPVALVTGVYGGRFVVEPTNTAMVLPVNIALYTRPQRQRVVFPTMLRKMWSGGEVQAWLDENVNEE